MNILEQQKLIDEYTPWIMKQADKFYMPGIFDIEFEDLVSVGQMAIFEALESFNESLEVQENTHIMNIIRYRIMSALRKHHKIFNQAQYNRSIQIKAVVKELGEEATDVEVYNRLKSKSLASNVSLKTVIYMRELLRLKIVSSEIPTYRGTRHPLADGISDHDVEDAADKITKYRRIYELIDTLKPKQKQVMLGRLEGKTLEELGDEMKLSRERIRQLENTGRRILKDRAAKVKYTPIKRVKIVEFDNKIKVLTDPRDLFTGDVDMITTDEFQLDPGAFKMLQYLKRNRYTSIMDITKKLSISHKSVQVYLRTLRDANYISSDNNVLDDKYWPQSDNLVPLRAYPLERRAFEEEKEDLVKKPVISISEEVEFVNLTPNPPKPIPIPELPKATHPDMHVQTIVVTEDNSYPIVQDLGYGYEVFDSELMKHKVVKSNEILAIL